jgi:hypothetical protein
MPQLLILCASHRWGTMDTVDSEVSANYPWRHIMEADGNLRFHRLANLMQPSRIKYCCWIGMAVCLLLSGCDAWIRAQGSVRDRAGKPIANATITLKTENDSRTFRSEKDGHYIVQIWQPPMKLQYKLTVTKAGFFPYEKQLTGPGVYRDLDVVLEPASADSGLPQETVTPRGIARAMFPNAPEKTKNVSCFRGLTAAMSMNTVVEKCGRPDEELGSGIYIFVWHLADGSTISIGTPYLDRIADVRFTDASGKASSLLDAK